jgi:hypothetical protein
LAVFVSETWKELNNFFLMRVTIYLATTLLLSAGACSNRERKNPSIGLKSGLTDVVHNNLLLRDPATPWSSAPHQRHRPPDNDLW